MAEKVSTKRSAAKRAVNKTVTEPFAEPVEAAPKKRASRKPAVAKPAPAAEAVPAEAKPPKQAVAKRARKPVKAVKPVTRKAKTAPVDPFAEIATPEVTVASTKKARKTRTVAKKSEVEAAPLTLDVTAELAAAEPAVELSPVFKALAEVKLPELHRENRARLQMQSPTRLYFYWSLKENPWHQLRGVFGDDLGAYTLVVKLTDLTHDIEHIHPCDAEGNWWFAAEPGTEYQAEIGFYATNRPYFRVLYSNTVTTPLRSPSPHPAEESQWTVSATKFAEVLDASGFARDAFDVAMAGDDMSGADRAARTALSRVIANGEAALDRLKGGDIRYAIAALAAGTRLEELRWQVDERLFAILQANAEKLTASSARSAMGEYFETDDMEFDVTPAGSTVFGASLVHFPQRVRSRRQARYHPISSQVGK